MSGFCSPHRNIFMHSMPRRERLSSWAKVRGCPLQFRLSAASVPSFLMKEGEGGDWVRHPNAAGIETRELHRDADSGIRTFYLRRAPGAAIPPHRHLTAEECFVISGELESFGTILRPGDYIRAASGTQHGTSRSEGGCLLLLTSAMNSSLT